MYTTMHIFANMMMNTIVSVSRTQFVYNIMYPGKTVCLPTFSAMMSWGEK